MIGISIAAQTEWEAVINMLNLILILKIVIPFPLENILKRTYMEKM